MRVFTPLIAMLLYAAPAIADQNVIPNYRSARDTWRRSSESTGTKRCRWSCATRTFTASISTAR
jgi:hypothetical protein